MFVPIPVVGVTKDGDRVWYTGKAGEGFVSANPQDAFLGYSLEGARNRAKNLNRMVGIHGIWFVACVGELNNLGELKNETSK